MLPANSFSSTSASAPPPPERTIPPPRRSSPEPRRRREPSPPPAKRFKASSPPPARRDRGRDRDRDHRRDDTRREDSGPASRRPSPPPMREAIPPAILWFLGTLPSANAFDGGFRHLIMPVEGNRSLYRDGYRSRVPNGGSYGASEARQHTTSVRCPQTSTSKGTFTPSCPRYVILFQRTYLSVDIVSSTGPPPRRGRY